MISPHLLQQMFDNLRDNLFVVREGPGDDFTLVNINPACARFFRATPEQLAGRRVSDIVDDRSTWRSIIENYKRVVRTGECLNYEEQTGNTRFGYQVFETHLFPVRENGQIYVCGISRNISKRKQAERQLAQHHRQLNSQLLEIKSLQEKLKQQAIRDPLTNVFNRRYLDEKLNYEIDRARRENQNLSLVMFDIDRFKKLNDTYGHQVGDQLLIEVADFFRRQTRKTDMLFRYGGEEFLLVLPATSLRTAHELSDKWRQEFSDTTYHLDIAEISMTLSAGVACFPDHVNGAFELVNSADQALYHAKQEGRDRVCIYQPA